MRIEAGLGASVGVIASDGVNGQKAKGNSFGGYEW